MVTFPDVPGALTWGADIGEALENAEEVLELALGDYIENRKELPTPSLSFDNQELVVLHPAVRPPNWLFMQQFFNRRSLPQS